MCTPAYHELSSTLDGCGTGWTDIPAGLGFRAITDIRGSPRLVPSVTGSCSCTLAARCAWQPAEAVTVTPSTAHPSHNFRIRSVSVPGLDVVEPTLFVVQAALLG